MRSGQSSALLLDVVELLRTENIDYAAVGAIAASVHGVVRASLDADAVVRVTVQELGAIQKKLAVLGLETELRCGDINDPIPGMLLVTDAFGNRVDLLAGMRGLEPAAYTRATDVLFMGEKLRVIGREDFIAMKCFAGGPIDLVDACRAIAVSGNSLDRVLLQQLLARFGKDAMENYDRLRRE